MHFATTCELENALTNHQLSFFTGLRTHLNASFFMKMPFASRLLILLTILDALSLIIGGVTNNLIILLAFLGIAFVQVLTLPIVVIQHQTLLRQQQIEEHVLRTETDVVMALRTLQALLDAYIVDQPAMHAFFTEAMRKEAHKQRTKTTGYGAKGN